MRRSKQTERNVIPLDAEKTLYETSSRDVWQSTLMTTDGVDVGPVIRQVIEPKVYTIRYLIVFDIRRGRHVLHPSNAIEDITEDRVFSSLNWHEIEHMPTFCNRLTRQFEQRLYDGLGRVPYWKEEEAILKQDD